MSTATFLIAKDEKWKEMNNVQCNDDVCLLLVFLTNFSLSSQQITHNLPTYACINRRFYIQQEMHFKKETSIP